MSDHDDGPEEISVENILKLLDAETKAISTTSRYHKQFARLHEVDSSPWTTRGDQPGIDSPSAMVSSMDDRTLHVPKHTGHYIFPNHALFNRLVRFAHVVPQQPCIRDDNILTLHGAPQEADHIQLLSDVIHLRARLWRTLTPSVRQAIEERQEVYIAVLAPGGYEYAIAMLAVVALGAAVVPMTVALPAAEAVYFITKSRSAAVLCADGAIKLGTQLERLVRNRNSNSSFSCLSIKPSMFTTRLRPLDFLVSSDRYMDENSPGVVIFTSGTTGPSKGSVMRKAFIFDTAMAVADHYQLSRSDTVLHLLPVHHATGVGIMFFPPLIAGALIEFNSGGFSAEWTWNRWRSGGITFFSGVPTIYMRMRRHFEEHIASLPPQERDAYIDGARNLRCCLCGTSALPKPIADFWREILGKNILLRYGATEMGAVFKVRMNDDQVPDGSVGNVFAGCDIKLRPIPDEEDSYAVGTNAGEAVEGDVDDADEGEVCIKSPEMFSKYIFDPEATAKAHTADGYYRSGDIARKEVVNGETYYWILGRASVDIIKSGGYKISALDIEREILALPYVAEVMVVGVSDEEFGQRVAGVVVLKPGEMRELPIQRLRQDLRSSLAGYKLPTLLRVMETELPKSGTGKVVKKILGPQFFPRDYRSFTAVQVWTRSEEAKPKL